MTKTMYILLVLSKVSQRRDRERGVWRRGGETPKPLSRCGKSARSIRRYSFRIAVVCRLCLSYLLPVVSSEVEAGYDRGAPFFSGAPASPKGKMRD